MSTVKTTCPYCGVGCGVLVTKTETGVTVKGDPDHPSNLGRLCSKGSALAETLKPETRLLEPSINGRACDWETATSAVAAGLQGCIEEHGPDSVAFYVSGQLLTEDYYISNKLMKGFIGSANIDTNSRLCMASTVAGHKRAFGSDTVPGNYTDLEEADLVVLVGSNLAWCHPVLFQRLKAAKEKRGTKVVVIDPRRTDTCDIADLHIPIMPDGDVLLFNGLLHHLHETGQSPTDYTRQFVENYDETIKAAVRDTSLLETAAKERGITEEVKAFFDLFSSTEKVVTVFSQGVNQAHNGTDRVNAIINCHLGTGRIGKPGMGPFSVTGQPNAMGGREVGGLANMLAVHMGFSPEEVDRVGRFWGAPNMASEEGKRAVDMFEAVHSGKIKAIWIMATNPAVSMPKASRVREALKKCPLVIVSDCVDSTDTLDFAHIRLPATGWSEKDGTVTNSDRTISRQRAFLPPMGQAKPDWQIMCEVAGKMGWEDQFNYEHASEIFSEYAALSGFENYGKRDFDISGLNGISHADYDDLEPTKWPCTLKQSSTERLFGDGKFFTENGKANMVPVEHTKLGHETDKAYPLLLNTGRYRDQWHTMTRTALAPKLNGHRPEALLEVNPEDALKYGLVDGGFAEIKSDHGRYIARVRLTANQMKDEVFLPMHWSGKYASKAVVGELVSQTVDPFSKQPAFKSTPVSVSPKTMPWKAIMLTRQDLTVQHHIYWTKTLMEHCTLMKVASDGASTLEMGHELIKLIKTDQGDWMEYIDTCTGAVRAAAIKDGKLEAILFSGPALKAVNLNWLADLFGQDELSPQDRQTLLAGRGRGAMADPGPTICSCFGVGYNDIAEAVRSGKCTTTQEIGAQLCAGTNCGSCIPELKNILAKESQPEAKKEDKRNAA